MRIVLLCLQARRRSFRFICVWVVWVLLDSVLCCVFLRVTFGATSLGERPRACQFWNWCGAVVFRGCVGEGVSREGSKASLLVGRQAVARFGLFRLRLYEFSWVGRSQLCLLWLSDWEVLCASL